MLSEAKEKTGVIGLGIIGSRVAERLRTTDRQVYVWSRSPHPVPNFLSSPGEIAQLARTIQIFVDDGEALVEVVEAMQERLSPDHIVINHATVNPEQAVAAYEIAQKAGAAFLDVPFSGSRGAAEKGALIYFAGGDPAVLEKVRPLLEASAREILYLGRVGEASLLKIATSMVAAASVEALAEAYGLIHAAGIDSSRLQEALEHDPAGSPLLVEKLASMRERDFAPRLSLDNMFAASQVALNLAKVFDIDFPALSSTASVHFRRIRSGDGALDFSAVARNYLEDR